MTKNCLFLTKTSSTLLPRSSCSSLTRKERELEDDRDIHHISYDVICFAFIKKILGVNSEHVHCGSNDCSLLGKYSRG